MRACMQLGVFEADETKLLKKMITRWDRKQDLIPDN